MCRRYSSSVILQRPFPIYELDVNSRNTIGAGAARANGRVRGYAVLLARQANEATLRYLHRGKDRRSPGADVFGHCVFTLTHFAVDIDQFETHIDGEVSESEHTETEN